MKTLTFDARLDGVSISTDHWRDIEQECSIKGIGPQADLSMTLKLRAASLFADPESWARPIKVTVEFQEPKTKVVPWKAEEVPLGAWFRRKGETTGAQALTCVAQVCVHLAYGSMAGSMTATSMDVSFASLATRWEVTTDGGKTWKPAGRVETTYE